MMKALREHVLSSNDKAIIVSEWLESFKMIKRCLDVERVTYCELNGKVLVKNRNKVVEEFNDPKSGIKIMLLSLTAGGVGLNLVGASYLFLMDLHWDPQLEQQAQDRIYPFRTKERRENLQARFKTFSQFSLILHFFIFADSSAETPSKKRCLRFKSANWKLRRSRYLKS
jgi:Helicase conserved C-terminal domain